MDILGVGAGEMIVIALVIMVVAGPRRSAEWAREAGKYLRQFQLAWQKMWNEVKVDLGPEGEELMKAAQEIRKTTSDIQRVTSPRNLVGQTMSMGDVLDPAKIAAKAKMETNKTNGTEAAASENPPSEDRYDAWKPAQDDPN
ncbi:MAG: twin-arginine translocase TatA/TatE family subunit [Chloroflexi bacterium]|nr:twin-arginine translocase TatA/TatE family subunit [Chloroflexota bacterium]